MPLDEIAVGGSSGDEVLEARHRKLWRRVLLQGLQEAAGAGRNLIGLAKNARSREVLRAQRWVTTDSEDIRWVCDMAGLDVRMLFKYTRRKYGRGK
jgi:hypothetical protein